MYNNYSTTINLCDLLSFVDHFPFYLYSNFAEIERAKEEPAALVTKKGNRTSGVFLEGEIHVISNMAPCSCACFASSTQKMVLQNKLCINVLYQGVCLIFISKGTAIALSDVHEYLIMWSGHERFAYSPSMHLIQM